MAENGYSVAAEAAAQNSFLQQQLTNVMRSFKDELAFNLQTLNLTLNGLTSSMNNLNGKIGALDPNTAGRYINAGLNSGAFLGNVSRQFANYRPLDMQNSVLGGVFNTNYRRPFNVSPQEYYMGSDINRATMGSAAAANIASSIPNIIGLGSGAIGTALGSFPLTAPLAIPVALGGQMIASGIESGTSAYLDQSKMLMRMGGRFGNVPTWMEARQGARGLQQLAYDEAARATPTSIRLGEKGYRDVAMMGLQGDLLHGANMDQLIRQVGQLGEVVKVMTGILGSPDTKTTMDAIIQMKNMGLNLAKPGGAAQASTIASNAYGYGFNQSMSASQMLQAGMQVAQSGFGTNGIPAMAGINIGMHNIAAVSEMQKRGQLNAVDIAAGGGIQSMAAKLTGLYANSLQSGMGQMYMAAGLNNDGTFDISRANEAAAGGMLSTYSAGMQNMFGSKMNPMLRQSFIRANQSKIMSQIGKASIGEQLQSSNALLENELNMGALGYKGGSMNEQYYHGINYLMTQHGMDEGTASARMQQLLDPNSSMRLHRQNILANAESEVASQRVKTGLSYQFEDAVYNPIQKWLSRGKQGINNWATDFVDYLSDRRQSIHDIASEFNNDQNKNRFVKYDTFTDENGLESSRRRIDYGALNKSWNDAVDIISKNNFMQTDQQLADISQVVAGRNAGMRTGQFISGYNNLKSFTFNTMSQEGLAAAAMMDNLAHSRIDFAGLANNLDKNERVNEIEDVDAALNKAGINMSIDDYGKAIGYANERNSPLRIASNILRGQSLTAGAELDKAIRSTDFDSMTADEGIQKEIRAAYLSNGGDYSQAIESVIARHNPKDANKIHEQAGLIANSDSSFFGKDTNTALAMASGTGRTILSNITRPATKNADYGSTLSSTGRMVNTLARLAGTTDENKALERFEELGIDVNDSILFTEENQGLNKYMIEALGGNNATSIDQAKKIDLYDKYMKEKGLEVDASTREKYLKEFTKANIKDFEKFALAKSGEDKRQARSAINTMFTEFGLVSDNVLLDKVDDQLRGLKNLDDETMMRYRLVTLAANQSDTDLKNNQGMSASQIKKFRKEYGDTSDIIKIQAKLQDKGAESLTASEKDLLAKHGLNATTESINNFIKTKSDKLTGNGKEALNQGKRLEKYDSEKTINDCIGMEAGQAVLYVKQVEEDGWFSKGTVQQAQANRKRCDEIKDKMEKGEKLGAYEQWWYQDTIKNGSLSRSPTSSSQQQSNQLNLSTVLSPKVF